MITDPKHLDAVLTRLTGNLSALADAWRDEDHAACAPAGQSDGPGGQGPGDPTPSIAARDRKWEHRDRIGRTLLKLSRQVESEVDGLKPRVPSEPCGCCGDEMATHGRLCYECLRYRRVMDRACDSQVHDLRPRVKMCGCPGWCCEVCSDRAAPKRSVSERCKKRMDRKGGSDG